MRLGFGGYERGAEVEGSPPFYRRRLGRVQGTDAQKRHTAAAEQILNEFGDDAQEIRGPTRQRQGLARDLVANGAGEADWWDRHVRRREEGEGGLRVELG